MKGILRAMRVYATPWHCVYMIHLYLPASIKGARGRLLRTDKKIPTSPYKFICLGRYNNASPTPYLRARTKKAIRIQ